MNMSHRQKELRREARRTGLMAVTYIGHALAAAKDADDFRALAERANRNPETAGDFSEYSARRDRIAQAYADNAYNNAVRAVRAAIASEGF